MENETKVCKYCQTEIPKKAKICPNCKKKQGGIGKWVIIGIVAIIILARIASGGTENSEPSDSNPKKTEQASEESKQEKQKKNEFSVGDVVETSNLRISYLSAGEHNSNNEFIQPKEGNVYYKMDFEFENISDSDEYISSFSFNCYADGYSVEQAYMDGEQLDATLSPGKKTKGSVFFEVPKDANEITIEYETNFWTENKIVFIVK